MEERSLPLVELLAKGAGEDARRQVAFYLEGKRPPSSMDTPLTMNTLGG
jgi:hypothetical protein